MRTSHSYCCWSLHNHDNSFLNHSFLRLVYRILGNCVRMACSNHWQRYTRCCISCNWSFPGYKKGKSYHYTFSINYYWAYILRSNQSISYSSMIHTFCIHLSKACTHLYINLENSLPSRWGRSHTCSNKSSQACRSKRSQEDLYSSLCFAAVAELSIFLQLKDILMCSLSIPVNLCR